MDDTAVELIKDMYDAMRRYSMLQEDVPPYPHLRLMLRAESLLKGYGRDTVLSPEETVTLDFIGIGFDGGVETAVSELAKVFPDVEGVDLDINQLRRRWSETAVLNEAGLLGLDSRGITVTHAWVFGWLAWQFLDYMQQVGAKNFVRQEVMPKLSSGVGHIMIEVAKIGWARQRNREYEEFKRGQDKMRDDLDDMHKSWNAMLLAVARLSDAMGLDDGDWSDPAADLGEFDPWQVIARATEIMQRLNDESSAKEEKDHAASN